MGCCGSKKRSDQHFELERIEVHGAKVWSPAPAPAVQVYHYEVDQTGRSAHHDDESQFFWLFFSVMNHHPDHQGTLRRWEKADQQAGYNGGRCEMRQVWWDGVGYVKTLQRVQLFVTDKRFSWAVRKKLAELAKKVVKRRNAAYYVAKDNGRADSKHLKVLEEWRCVKNILQDLI